MFYSFLHTGEYSDDSADFADRDVSASFRFAGYSLIPGGEKWTSVFLRINENINKRIILTGV
ncbi:hypothetical protein [Morganella morganii IS15]|nr:hypothetical protein [Morganella morganii IS15]